MKPKVSIVIPAYNAEKYIKQCLSSLINQTLKEIEVIIVNDGSTDGTLNVIMDYAEKYKNVILINQENQGVSTARNSGMKRASGEYITFVDADDWIDEGAYESLYALAYQNKCDVLQFNYFLSYEGKKIKNDYKMLPNQIYSSREIQLYIYKEFIRGRLQTYTWDKIYRLDFLKNNNIVFENYSIYEDWYFNLKVATYMTSYLYTNEYLYNYRILNNSLSKKLYLNKDLLLIQLHRAKKQYMDQWGMNTTSNMRDFQLSFFNDVFNYIGELYMNTQYINLKLRFQKIKNMVDSGLLNNLDIKDLMRDIGGNGLYDSFVLVCMKYKLSILLWMGLEIYFTIIRWKDTNTAPWR